MFLGRRAQDGRRAYGYYGIEACTGVREMLGRGPHGLKYRIADLTPIIAGQLGMADAVAINLATAHDTPGTATAYRQRVRRNPAMLVQVGRIVWGVRKALREAADAQFTAELTGLPTEGESIAAYRVQADGVLIRLHAADATAPARGVWVPWAALEAAGERGVHRLLIEEARSMHEVDDDARELRFTGVGVVCRLDTMLARAYRNRATEDSADAIMVGPSLLNDL
jgi:hypothetical protein